MSYSFFFLEHPLEDKKKFLEEQLVPCFCVTSFIHSFSFFFLLLFSYSQLNHVKFGRIHGMSSRRGSVILLQDVLNEAKERALQTLRVTKSQLHSCL